MSKKAKHTQMSLESEASKNSNSNQTLSEVKQNRTFQNPYLVEVGRNINLKIGQIKQLTNGVVKEFNDNEMKQLMHEKDQDRILNLTVTVSNNKFRGRGKSISGMVDRYSKLTSRPLTPFHTKEKPFKCD